MIQPSVYFQMARALTLTKSKEQWVDVGVTEGCFPSPLTCGDRGGSLVFWVKPGDSFGYLFSSFEILKYHLQMLASKTDIW